MRELPSVRTERLILRPWRGDDLDEYARMTADPEVMRYLGDGQSVDRAAAWRQIAVFIGHWQLRGYGQWVVERLQDGAFMGRAGLWQPEGWPGLEVGWALARGFWGNGYATEAGKASVEFAGAELQAPELISVIHPENVPSQRVAERLGMKPDRRQTLGANEVIIYKRSLDQ